MAPSAGHLHQLVVKNVLKNLKLLKTAWTTASENVQSRLPTRLRLEAVPVRATRQPLHPVAALRQGQNRYYTTSRRLLRNTPAYNDKARVAKSSWPPSQTRTAVASLTGRTPFASTLRPNLTGGAFPRASGGYGLGSGRPGARYFSHTPAAPAQVMQNVSQALRAFMISGQKAKFDGTDPHTGAKRYRAVSSLQGSTAQKIRTLPRMTPGSYVDFSVNPTITALTPIEAVAGYAGFSVLTQDTSDSQCANQFELNLNTPSLLDLLSADFSRALKDLAAILNDLKALSQLGDLPITYAAGSGCSKLRVHFPGCDAEAVENLCREFDVKRGVVMQDADFDTFAGAEIALLFPFAAGASEDTRSSASCNIRPHAKAQEASLALGKGPQRRIPVYQSEDSFGEQYSTLSNSGLDLQDGGASADEVSLSSSEGRTFHYSRSGSMSEAGSPLEYQDFEGIYRFIELCDESRR